MLKTCSVKYHLLTFNNGYGQAKACNLKNILNSGLKCSNNSNLSRLYLTKFELKLSARIPHFRGSAGSIQSILSNSQLLSHVFASLQCGAWPRNHHKKLYSEKIPSYGPERCYIGFPKIL